MNFLNYYDTGAYRILRFEDGWETYATLRSDGEWYDDEGYALKTENIIKIMNF